MKALYDKVGITGEEASYFKIYYTGQDQFSIQYSGKQPQFDHIKDKLEQINNHMVK